jgi:glycosyltransferase involved in cell wall biosynthesis
VLLADWLPPDFGAIGQYALLEAQREADAGHEVTLVGLASAGDSTTEEERGAGRLRVVRIARPVYDRDAFGRRARWTARTNLVLLRRSWRWLRRADEIRFTGSPPFLVHLLVPANLFLRRRLVYRIADFHPECLIAELGRTPFPLGLLLGWTRLLRRRVDQLEVLGEDQRQRLVEGGIRPERIAVTPLASPVAIGPETAPLPAPESLAGTRRLLYSGNFGVAHDHATVIEGLRLHHARGGNRFGLWLNATGAKADRVESELRRLGLPVHRSTPGPLADLARLLVSADAHLITLRDEFVGYVLPSKVWGCVESRRPILFVGSAASDVHRICAAALPAGSYERVDVGDAEGFASALERLGR